MNNWVFVEAEKLSTKDSFMKYNPSTFEMKLFKERVAAAVNMVTDNFYCSKDIPKKGTDGGISFDGTQTITGRNCKWWEWAARMIEPYFTRLGTYNEEVVLYAVVIKQLVEELGWKIAEAWKAVYALSPKLKESGLELAEVLISAGESYRVVGKDDGQGFLISYRPQNLPFDEDNPYKALKAYGWIVREVND